MTTWNAADYHRNSTQQQTWARELIDKLQLSGDESVLDLGCGDGKISAEIAAALPDGNVVGVDVSDEMIAFAQKNFPTAQHSNLSFVQGDASTLAFDREFDVVFSNAVLHWILDHRPVLRGIARALKPGGRALLQMGGKGNAADVLATVHSLIADPRWNQYFADFRFPYGFFAPGEYRGWLIEAGLDPVRVELIPKRMDFPNVTDFAGWFRTTWMPYINRVPGDEREAFIDEVIASYVREYCAEAHGSVTVRMIRLEVDAKKFRK